MKLPDNEKLIKEFKKIYKSEPSTEELIQFSHWYKEHKVGTFYNAIERKRIRNLDN
jgi:predicted transcriptional regulator